MTARELQAFLHANIPATAALSLSVVDITPDSLILSAPHAPNRNYKNTVFGGTQPVSRSRRQHRHPTGRNPLPASGKRRPDRHHPRRCRRRLAQDEGNVRTAGQRQNRAGNGNIFRRRESGRIRRKICCLEGLNGCPPNTGGRRIMGRTGKFQAVFQI